LIKPPLEDQPEDLSKTQLTGAFQFHQILTHLQNLSEKMESVKKTQKDRPENENSIFDDDSDQDTAPETILTTVEAEISTPDDKKIEPLSNPISTDIEQSPNSPFSPSTLVTLQKGLQVDALDRCHHWYNAQVIEVRPGKTRVRYNGFAERWDDWIAQAEHYRIASYQSRCITKAKDNDRNPIGTHVLAATKYAKSDKAKSLRNAIESGSMDFSNVHVLMAGSMHKKGNWRVKWNLRYFTLRNDCCLYYYLNSFTTFEFRGVIPLSSINRRILTSDEKFEFGIALETTHRTYHLGCQNEEDQRDWMSAIVCLTASPLEIQSVPSPRINRSKQNIASLFGSKIDPTRPNQYLCGRVLSKD